MTKNKYIFSSPEKFYIDNDLCVTLLVMYISKKRRTHDYVKYITRCMTIAVLISLGTA